MSESITSGGDSSSNVAEGYNNDPLYLHPADHPGIPLTNVKLEGSNFQKWSRTIKMALKTKVKLGFIDGKCPKPASGSPNYEQWIKVDSMVVSWILNAMVPDLSDSFMYVDSAQNLWKDLIERFGQSNGPLVYHLKKELTDLYQNSDPVAVYFTKLKRIWDELSDVSETLICNCKETCPSIKQISEGDQKEKLLQFLMHLNEEYDSIRSQVLLLDPLPSLNKAYNMVQQVEKQRQITSSFGQNRDVAAAVTNKESIQAKNFKARKEAKARKFCDHCKRNGHDIDQCFLLHGYPDWWKGSKDNKRQLKVAANVTKNDLQDTPLEDSLDQQQQQVTSASKHKFDPDLIQALAQELSKLNKNKSIEDQTFAQFAGSNNFSGPFN